MILSLWKLDVDDFWFFGYVDFPDVESLVCAFATLVYLGALDQHCKLTNIGEFMSVFPLEPQMSKVLAVSPDFNCSQEILSISSMLSGWSIQQHHGHCTTNYQNILIVKQRVLFARWRGIVCKMERSCNRWRYHYASQVVFSRVWYSASEDERERKIRFFDFQLIREEPGKSNNVWRSI
ncbi:pre-mRNA-splicing factor ATP-dependent RNA helicase prp22-like [Lathyrus oleraceus]|uniref:pre-mRNA-splicing factor ATP-dependent RNA helicase prp22-like n=1 Tax=Pisum sativum TaxID=3888 RepID=UPI0021D3CE73|nr:pre-mRNA-splicing factor ATP-dependent RNA helicase prp22-like [Pisum sativum]